MESYKDLFWQEFGREICKHLTLLMLAEVQWCVAPCLRRMNDTTSSRSPSA